LLFGGIRPSFLVFPNGHIMFLEGGREVVGSVILGDEIEVFRCGGIEGSHNGFLARIANGSWG